jgi:natural product biosynthesis luciferase-like monooxygenase protein
LWRGESVPLRNGSGRDVETRILPHPIQKELPVWLTALSEQTFVRAGALGANVLTGLMERDIESCGRMIQRYRTARAEHGFDPAEGVVTVMVHTYMGTNVADVRRAVRGPMQAYLRSFLEMSELELRSSPEFGDDVRGLSARDRDALLEYAFERYFQTRSLLGTAESCQATLARLSAVGIDEVACLLDFGLDVESVLAGLENLNAAREMFQARPPAATCGQSAGG